jgi:hypothetical protein
MTRDPEAHITSARVKALYDYWLAKRGGRRMPGRADIDPAEIKPLLPYVVLTDVHRNPLRIYFRLVGTAVAAAAGRNLTGLWLHEVQVDGGIDLWMSNYHRLVAAREPVFGRTRATLRVNDVRVFEWILLPLGSDGETVDKTLELEDWSGLRHMSGEQIDRADWRIEVFE